MATGYIPINVLGHTPPDGSTSNAAPQIERVKSSASAPSLHFNRLLFDASTDEHAYFQIPIPGNYASSPVLKIKWQANATTGNVVWGARLAAITAGDTDTPQEKALATAQTTTTSVNTTEANREVETSITITNTDSVAAGDSAYLLIYRDADNASDTCSVDAAMLGAVLEYVTT
jgi:hypothetical protein